MQYVVIGKVTLKKKTLLDYWGEQVEAADGKELCQITKAA
jgi:hypothetical protein